MKNKNKFKLYGAFEKAEKLEDGTLIVSGIASSEAVDAAGEVVKAEAMAAAIPDYMQFGAVREMHQPIAAGVALKCEVGEDAKTYFEAKVVDPVTVKKVEEGVLKGFSIGGKVTKRDDLNKAVITGLKLTEISLVDRPCNPEALVSLGKVEGDEPTLGDLRKVLFDVQDFADILQRIFYLTYWQGQEAEYEGDGSPIPAQLRDWMAQGAAIFQALAKEEIEELLAQLPAPPAAEVLEMAEKLAKGEMPEGLEKAGAKFSKAVKAALSEVHKAVKDCDTKLAALGYDAAEEDEDGKGKGDEAEKLAKLDAEKGEALAKVEQLQEELKKVQGEAADLRKQVEDLKAQPAAPKGVKVVTKGQDIGDPEQAANLEKQAEEIKALPPEEQAQALIKFIHGGR